MHTWRVSSRDSARIEVPMRVSRPEFERLVAEVLETLPDDFARCIAKVEIVIEGLPPVAVQKQFPGGHLLGLYQGTPMTRESTFRPYSMPNRISLYQRNIERICRTREQICEQVRITLLHEIGHHFGMKEGDLHEAGY